MKLWEWLLITAGSIGTGVFIIAYSESKEVSRQLTRAFTPPSYKVQGIHTVSVIVPALEEEDYLTNLLQSVNSQTYTPIESIVADSSTGESKSKTQQICARYGAEYVYVPRLNVGLARNKGAAKASGDILCFVDADCVMSQEYVARIVNELEKPDVALAHGADPFYEDGSFQSWSIIMRSFLKPKTYTTGRGICIWKDAFNQVGGYTEIDPRTGFREDLDLGRKVAEAYGRDSISLLRDVFIGESHRRFSAFPAPWTKIRGVRKGRIINEGH